MIVALMYGMMPRAPGTPLEGAAGEEAVHADQRIAALFFWTSEELGQRPRQDRQRNDCNHPAHREQAEREQNARLQLGTREAIRKR
jgi:hypothetical protein